MPVDKAKKITNTLPAVGKPDKSGKLSIVTPCYNRPPGFGLLSPTHCKQDKGEN